MASASTSATPIMNPDAPTTEITANGVAGDNTGVSDSPFGSVVEEPQNAPGQSSTDQQRVIDQLLEDKKQLIAQHTAATATAAQAATTAQHQQQTEHQTQMAQLQQQQTPQPTANKVTHPNLAEVKDLINEVMKQQSEVNMNMFKDLMSNQGFSRAEKHYPTEYKPPRQRENRIEAKSFQRMTQFVGGETDYKE